MYTITIQNPDRSIDNMFRYNTWEQVLAFLILTCKDIDTNVTIIIRKIT